jgi:hypothetical protein
MSLTRRFPAQIELRNLVEILNSLGSHLAAKLEHFGSDERTLTDELCDMFYIWCQAPRTSSSQLKALLGSLRLDIEVSKTTQNEESIVGADLAFHIESPLGVKRALFQAKVLDPVDKRLRCDPSGWDKLWSQLVLMRKRSPKLAFLLIYVPRTNLDGQQYSYTTWEQGFDFRPSVGASSKFGISLIPVDSLIDSNSDWRNGPPVKHLGGGEFHPRAISLARLVIDMLVCKRGSWQPRGSYTEDLVHRRSENEGFPVHYTPYRQIGLSASGSVEDWNRLVARVEGARGELETQ